MPGFYDSFVEIALRQPRSAAVEVQKRDSVESYTYEDIGRMAEAVGRWLTENGVKPGARAVIFADNHPHWFAAYLGIIATGAVAVPLDTALNVEQAARLLEDSGCSWVFCASKYLPVVREWANSMGRIIVLDSDGSGDCTEISGSFQSYASFESILAKGPGSFTPITSPGDSLAVLLYTSGTTADPKGVMLSHENMMAEVNAAVSWAPLGPSDSVLGVLPLFHVLAQITNFVVPLAVGARVVFLETLNSAELLRALSEREITALSAVPQLFYLIHERIFKQIKARGRVAQSLVFSLMALTRLLRRIGLNPGRIFFARIHGVFGDSMRYLLSAGSRFDPKVARDFWSFGLDILQAYGLTETSAAAFATPPGNLVIGSVGPPLSGVEGRIVDSQFDENIGQLVGEITIRGKLVMNGYWNRPEITATVIRDGWLYTGDLGYFDARGNLFITGRKKEVIILGNGKNIYPEEVEAHYSKSPFIKEMCVLGHLASAHDPASERLHAVVVPNFDELKKRKIVNAREVLRFDIEGLSAQQPSTKRIGSYEIWQEDLPRTTTRKIKRFEVERLVRLRRADKASTVESEPAKLISAEDSAWLHQKDVQHALAVVRGMCHSDRVVIRPEANLELDLGFDSMQRIELISAIEEALGGRADQAQYSEVYTVRQLVDVVRASVGPPISHPGSSQTLPWRKILTDHPLTPEVLALVKPRPIMDGLLFVLSRFVGVIAHGAFRVRVSGIEKLPRSGPFLICPNHQSLMDSTMIASLLPRLVFQKIFAVGTSEIFSTGFMRAVARWWRIVVVDPDANLIPAMRAAAFGMKHGKALLLFPEGERSIDGAPKAFKRGAAILSIHLQVPIVPVAIEGFYDAWPRGKSLPRPTPLQIRFGDPIHPPVESEASSATYEQLTEEMRLRVVAIWEELRKSSRGRTRE